jgi:hypothetical protein
VGYQRYRILSLLCLLFLVADQSWNIHSVSLSQPKPISLEAKIYTNLGCSYALMVHEEIMSWCQSHPLRRCEDRPSEPQFPSPSLRMKFSDYYIHFIGVAAIQEGLVNYP